jgi:UTP--glucose-1-phosphate uridylyltransferase
LRIKKAVITAAGQSQRALPLQTLIDRDGQEKSVLCILIEQALAANVEEICVVVWPGDEARYADAAGRYAPALRFVPQPEPLGYGNAILCARDFTGAEPFLHMVGDHLYVAAGQEPSTHRLVALAESAECSVSGVQPTRESLLPHYTFGRTGGTGAA